MSQLDVQVIDPKRAWKDLLVASAPEQKLYLEELLRQYELEIVVGPDARGAQLAASHRRIRFDNKTMRVYWLLGFAGWRVIECYAPAIIAALFGLGTLRQWLDADTGLVEVEEKFWEQLRWARSLLSASSADQFEWPPEIPPPGTDRDSLSLEHRAVHDITLISTAYAFLHELRHVIFFRDGAPPARPEEELACDVFAREYLTARIGEYAKANGVPYEHILRKRSIASALGVLVLYETTDRWGDAGTEHYPPLAERMDAALRSTPLHPDDPFWVYYGAVLVAMLRRQKSALEVIGATAKASCEALVEEIRSASSPAT